MTAQILIYFKVHFVTCNDMFCVLTVMHMLAEDLKNLRLICNVSANARRALTTRKQHEHSCRQQLLKVQSSWPDETGSRSAVSDACLGWGWGGSVQIIVTLVSDDGVM